jgi:hypothetical protein
MPQDWQQLTKLTGARPLLVERVRLDGEDTSIEGSFELPPLARLSGDDQIFVIAFLRSHGSIKEMERTFGISYPTVKNRLNRIAAQFEFIDTDPQPPHSEVLAQLQRGDISTAEAIERLTP